MKTLLLLLVLTPGAHAAGASARDAAAVRCVPQFVPAAKKTALTLPDGKKIKIGACCTNPRSATEARRNISVG